MKYVNPLAVVLVAWCTAIGALFGAVLAGLVIGLTVVILATFVGGSR
jgi:hypothetical protein